MRFILLALFLCVVSVQAADVKITASLSVTNGTTNGQTITIRGNVRTWTNSVFVPGTQVLTNSTAAGAKSNLFSHLGLAGIIQVTPNDKGSTNFDLVGASGVNLTVSVSDGWAVVTYSTQTVSASVVGVRVPITAEPSGAQQTNIASALVSGIGLLSTNSFYESQIAVSNLVGLTNNQTISGNKTFTGTNHLSNSYGAWHGQVSNSLAISGNLSKITNGSWRGPTLIGDVAITNGSVTISNITDGQAYINLNAGGGGTIWTLSAIDDGLDNSLTLGQFGSGSSIAISTNGGTYIVGNGATAPTLTLGAYSTVATNVFEIRGASSQLIFNVNSNGNVYTPGTLHVAGGQTNITAYGTNNFSDIAFRRYSLSSLANGNNEIIVGTNTFVQLSGPTAAFTNVAINASPNRDGRMLILLNRTGFDMYFANESGLASSAAYRVVTATGADRGTTGNGAATLIYSASDSRWHLISIEQ
jgi:hypothetical protein